MINTSLRMKILSGLLCTGLALTPASLTFASVISGDNAKENTATSMNIKAPASGKQSYKSHHAEMKKTLKTVVKESVSSKIITKTEGDKVLEYVNSKSMKNRGDVKKDNKSEDGKHDGPKGGLFNDLVTEGILTQKKSDALRKSMYVKITEIRTVELKNGLNSLVVKKVLTVEQSNKVSGAITSAQVQKKKMFKKMKNMSENERKIYMEKMEKTKISPMKKLIDNGTITKEQELEIQKVLPQHNHGPHGPNGPQ
ncbi:hypothetical protein LGK95_08325 [Clostridium algoriphilum]|uniref:hypothetical protein n=1 Tax=Clostridium algoriphilum TaxID=198347 RepID=UPI001CF49CC5|nr:hypothetical protein [Clostridium algoriphilum]MCB2293525.1 hypothetical protein [Clostridium algoriphilum]